MSDNAAQTPNPYTAPQGDLNVPQGKVGAVAHPGLRLGAAIIDALIIGGVTIVPTIVLLGGWDNYLIKGATGGIVWKLILLLIGVAGYLVINGYLLAQNGQTVGKKLVGIKIVRQDGSKPSLQHILIWRQAPIWVVQLIPYIGPILILIDVLLIFRESRQCAHDQIANTVVVNV